MKLRSLLLNGVATWLLYADPVQAAPVVGAVTAFAGWLGGSTIGAIIVKGAIGLALNAGLSLVAKAKQKKALGNQPARGVNVSVRLGDNNPASFIIGRYATPGIRTYIGSWGQVSKTPNAYLTEVLELSSLPLPGLAGMWAGDKKCTVLWNEPVANGAGCPVQEFRVNGTDYMWVKFVDGTQTAADTFLRNTFGNADPRPFKDTMIGRGCAYVIVTTRFNQDLFASGKPEYLFEPSPPVFYDLRKDSTNGGNGSHRWNDRSTWEPTENNAIISYNIIRGVYYLNNEWVYGGQSLAAFRLPASNWIAAANECDRLITKADGGTEKQFRCGYEVQANTTPLQLLEELRVGCSGRFAEVGGVFKMSVGAPGAAVYHFTDDDVVVTSEQELDPFPPLDDIHNGIEGEYPDPEKRWVMKDAPPRYDAALEAQDGNRRLVTGIDFPTTPFPTQVQRLMQAMLKDGRRFAVHKVNLPPDTKVLEPNDVVSWTSARNGYANKKFQIERKAGASNFRQGFVLKEIDPTDHGWTPGQEIPTPIGGGIGPIVVPPQPMTGWTATPDQVADADGKAMRPAIKIGCGADMDDVDRVHVMVRFKESQSIVFDSDQTPYPRPGTGHPYQWLLSGAWCLPAKWYQVAGKFVPKSNRPSTFGAWIDVLTPNVQATDVSVGLGQVQNDVNQRFKDLQAEFDAAFKRQSQSIIDFSLVNAIGHRQQMEMRAELGTALASISEERRVRVTEAEALAQQILTLRAQLGAANATITELRQTQATEDTALSSRLTTLDAKVGKNLARLELEEVVRASQNAVMASRAGMLEAQVASNRARIIAEETARADAVSAVAQSISGVSADLNDRFGGGLIKFAAAVDQSGVNVRYSIVMRANLGDQFKETGQYYEIYTENGVLKSRAATKVDQWVVTDGVTRNYAMVYQGGVLRLNIADIGTVYAGKMILGNGKLVIDGWYGTIEVWH